MLAAICAVPCSDAEQLQLSANSLGMQSTPEGESMRRYALHSPAHIVKEGHRVSGVDGKDQGQEGEEACLEGCHAVLEIQVQDVGCHIQQLRVGMPCGGGCSCCYNKKLGQALSAANR